MERGQDLLHLHSNFSEGIKTHTLCGLLQLPQDWEHQLCPLNHAYVKKKKQED